MINLQRADRQHDFILIVENFDEALVRCYDDRPVFHFPVNEDDGDNMKAAFEQEVEVVVDIFLHVMKSVIGCGIHLYLFWRHSMAVS